MQRPEPTRLRRPGGGGAGRDAAGHGAGQYALERCLTPALRTLRRQHVAVRMHALGPRVLAETAARLAQRGIPSFPCRQDKRPVCPRGFQDATAEPAAVRDLWRRYPGELIGIPTGEACGCDVLDLDLPRHPGAVRWWTEHQGQMPVTRVHRTRSGGLHVYFRHRAGMRSWTARPVPGVDGRADGGYVIAWALHGGEIVSRAEPAEWPALLLGLVLLPAPPPRPERPIIPAAGDRARRYALGALRRAVERVVTVGKGGRNVCLYGQVKDMCGFPELRAQEIADALAIAALSAGLDARETQATIASALRAGGAN